jgi:Prokaryotic RING finger family 1
MAILWQTNGDAQWSPTALHGASCLSGDSIELLQDASLEVARRDCLILTRPAAGALLNGLPLDAGIRVLADRDAIRLPGEGPRYFSTETLAKVETFPSQAPVICARCKLPLAPGDDAVACPTCGTWHHSPIDGGESCWTYAATCAALCGQATSLEAGYRWTPAEL